ncbi:MAG TPA: glycosyltransferase family 4 protein [Polyangiaceae bacterium]
MRIAQVSPLFESVPPRGYGGTERVVSWLTEELVRQGHEVTLFASGDSITTAELVPCCKGALWQDASSLENLPHHLRQLEIVMARAHEFDVVHFHSDWVHFPLARRVQLPALTTLHGALNTTDHVPLFREYDDMALVSISNAQRAPVPGADFRATVYHGMPRDLHRFEPVAGDYLAFLGRASPQKGLDRAIRIALRSGQKLKVAARICPEERAYHAEVIEPLLREAGPLVEWVGEVAGDDKDRFLRGARALLFPIDWEEPFGLVMIEALATGTPVLAWRRGSVPEVLEDGTTGFIVDSIDDAVAALPALGCIDRRRCRSSFERRFGVERMAAEYVNVYRALGERRSGPRILSEPVSRPRAAAE